MFGGGPTDDSVASRRIEDTVTAADPPAPADPHDAVISVHRLRVVYVGLAISWVLLAVLVVEAARQGVLDELRVGGPVAALAVGAVVVSALPWRRLATRLLGDVVVVLWAGGLVAGLIAANGVRNAPPLLAAFAGVVVFAAAMLLPPSLLAVVTAVTAGGYLLAVSDSPADVPAGELAAELITLGFMAALGLLLSWALRRHVAASAGQLAELRRRQDELTEREAALTRLYSVSRTIGEGTGIDEVLPELVSRVAAAVEARVGVVLFYGPQDQALEVVSPIWVSGHALRAEGYRLALTDAGLAQRVFISSDPAMVNDAAGFADDPLLAELADDNVAAVPLRLEARTMGVLLVTDRRDGHFTEEDLEILESLATPAALILNHLARFQEAQDTSRRMTEIARLKTDFVSVVSHELRTPLTSIIGALATLNRPQLAPTDPDARRLLQSARSQADRLKGLIEDLLVVSRLDNRALPVRPEPVDLDGFVKDVIQGLPGSDSVIRVDVAGDLGELSTDPEHLARILINLLDNALRYAAGSPIDVLARAVGSEIRLAVADRGPGIPYELHEHVFEQFTQMEQSDSRRGGGVGLGLSIVRGLTEAMGGRVWYEPTIGGGATFVVALPRQPGSVRRS